PETFALVLLNPLQTAEPLPPERFLRATAAWIAVLSLAADAAGEELTSCNEAGDCTLRQELSRPSDVFPQAGMRPWGSMMNLRGTPVSKVA
ncbi:hypothetical protein ACIOTI_41955, partial [Streptomyces sp. NPDC087843]